MKFNRNTYLGLLAICFLFLTACSTPQLAPGGVYQGNTVLYTMDNSIDTSYAFLDLFTKWENDNRVILSKRPEITKAADAIRINAPGWFKSAVACRDAYIASPTDTNQQKFTAALAVLRQAVTEATKYYLEANNLKPTK